MRRRRRVCEEMRDEGYTTVAIGKTLNVSNGQVSRWLRGRGTAGRWRPVPNTEPAAVKEKAQRARPPMLTDEHLRQIFAERAEWSGPAFSEALRQAFGVTYSPKYCAELLYRFRNNRPTRYLRTLTAADKERIAEQRRARNSAAKATREGAA